MAAGTLTTRVELIGINRVPDGAGGFTRADGVEATVWGHLAQASPTQQQRAERLEQRISHTIRIYWRPDFANGGFGPEARARIVDAGGAVRELSVRTVHDPDNRRRFLELGCLEGGPL